MESSIVRWRRIRLLRPIRYGFQRFSNLLSECLYLVPERENLLLLRSKRFIKLAQCVFLEDDSGFDLVQSRFDWRRHCQYRSRMGTPASCNCCLSPLTV